MVATMGEMIKVGMADLNICIAPDALTTLGLGSCVGVALYDAQMRIAGLVHLCHNGHYHVKYASGQQ